MAQNEQAKIMGKIISQCWEDEAYKQRFLADPAAVLKEAGAKLPAGVEFKAVENTENVNYIVIPARPGALSDEQLDAVSGGTCGCGGSIGSTGYSYGGCACVCMCE